SRDGRQSRYRARCGSDRGVRRSPEQVPCVPPTDSIAGMEVTGKMLDYTAHMYSSQDQTSSGRQSKVVRPVSAMACAARPRERAALQAQAAVQRSDVASGRWGRRGGAPAATKAKIPFILPIRGALPQPPKQKYRLFYLSAQPDDLRYLRAYL